MSSRTIFRQAVSLGMGIALFFGSVSSASATYFLNSEDADYFIQNDFFPRFTGGALEPLMSAGDFDGNGQDDVAIYFPRNYPEGEVVLLLNPTSEKDRFSELSTMRILVYEPIRSFGMVDLNNDGKKDLVMGGSRYVAPTNGQVDVILGRESPPEVLDLSSDVPDLRVLGRQNGKLGLSFATGDFNGDLAEDVFLGSSGDLGGCFLLGGKNLPLGLIDLSTDGTLPWITGPGLVGTLGNETIEMIGGDFNGDGKSDLALSSPSLGEIYIFFGQASFPQAWNISTLPANVTLTGPKSIGAFSGILALESGDISKDGRDELLVGWKGLITNTYSQTKGVIAIDGESLSTGGPNIAILPSGGPPAGVMLIPENTSELVLKDSIRLYDVDGDGAKDFVFYTASSNPGTVKGVLTSEAGMGLPAFEYKGPNGWSFEWTGTPNYTAGNFNGDSLRDVVAYESIASGFPYGHLRFLFGFRPLKNPSVQINERFPTQPRVTLSLHVEGAPTDVYFSGDVAESYRQRWLPYQEKTSLDLTSSEGTKTVRAIFRNTVGRQSETTSDTVSLGVGEPGTGTFTNVLRPGGQVRFDCHLAGAGHVKAEVFSREGQFIAQILDADYGPGVWPVVWDGKNAAGEVVVPGMYVVLITVNGHGENHKVIVQG